ncbi:MAG: TonB family protein [Saprospiraceae bacterium]|nr:MAG: outer membrane protein TonB [Bacteroidetes bacterium OLB9]MCO6464086.1 TonB family protein [Saprospiraceae bacterium]MCZ2339640.1 TonB family protein [Chitinophagales bacterium]
MRFYIVNISMGMQFKNINYLLLACLMTIFFIQCKEEHKVNQPEPEKSFTNSEIVVDTPMDSRATATPKVQEPIIPTPEKPKAAKIKPISKPVIVKEAPKPEPLKTEVEPPKIVDEEIFMRAEQMPRFPGCEQMKLTNVQKDRCAQQKMYEYIRSNLKYPQQALKNGVKGEVMVKFVVDKEGKISQVELLSDPGYGMGTAAVDVVKNMNNLSKRWTPGMQHGEPVSVWFMLPVKFSMDIK